MRHQVHCSAVAPAMSTIINTVMLLLATVVSVLCCRAGNWGHLPARVRSTIFTWT
jgi:hypothetical protein